MGFSPSGALAPSGGWTPKGLDYSGAARIFLRRFAGPAPRRRAVRGKFAIAIHRAE
jgi:hypothetical protein